MLLVDSMSYDDYKLMSNEELRRRISYDDSLMKQPSLNTVTIQKIHNDRVNCEIELERREG